MSVVCQVRKENIMLWVGLFPGANGINLRNYKQKPAPNLPRRPSPLSDWGWTSPYSCVILADKNQSAVTGRGPVG